MDDKQYIEKKRLKDTIFSFRIDELSTLNYMAETQNFFELNKFINQEIENNQEIEKN